MKSISVVIPHYPIDREVDTLLKKCISSLIGYTELFVIVNEGTGFGKAVNLGMSLTSGDYIAIVNNDVYMECGNLRDLAKDRVMSPARGFKDGPAIGMDFLPSCFVMPRWVYEKVGGFDEQFNLGDYEDDDWYERCKEEGIMFACNLAVRVYGKQGFTKSKMSGFKESSEKNKEKFIKKWGRLPEDRKEVFYE